MKVYLLEGSVESGDWNTCYTDETIGIFTDRGVAENIMGELNNFVKLDYGEMSKMFNRYNIDIYYSFSVREVEIDELIPRFDHILKLNDIYKGEEL